MSEQNESVRQSQSPDIEVSASGDLYIVRANVAELALKAPKSDTGQFVETTAMEGTRGLEEAGPRNIDVQIEDSKRLTLSSRIHGFYKTVDLPVHVNAEQARANFKDGVLEVTIPVQKAEVKYRRIPTESGSESVAKNTTENILKNLKDQDFVNDQVKSLHWRR